MRTVGGREVFLPLDGKIERLGDGHLVQLDFEGFSARLSCEVLSETEVRISVDLLSAEGDEPVVFSFFPAAADGALQVSDDGKVLEFGRVRISADRPVEIERDFKIASPYSMRREVDTKPVRAHVTLERTRRLILRIEISPAGDAPSVR